MASKLQKQKRQRSNLARTAIAMLTSDIKFNYGVNGVEINYTSIPPIEVLRGCHSSVKGAYVACMSGFGPIALKNAHNYHNPDSSAITNWKYYIFRTYGMSFGASDYDFVFTPDQMGKDSDNRYNKRAAASRAIKYLLEGTPDNYQEQYYTLLSDKELIKLLEVFVV